jgi:AcrR family transcriptional regulator
MERTYSMANRSAAAERTRDRILQAVLELATEKLTVEIVLTDVARRSGVTVQTILRHFISRDGLFSAAVEYAKREVVLEREAPVGDLDEALRVIVDHYEMRGDWVIALLGQENSDENVRAITNPGRETHREWVVTVFAPQIAARDDRSAEQLTDLLVLATDVYAWKVFRRDRQLDRPATEHRMRALVDAILASSQERN